MLDRMQIDIYRVRHAEKTDCELGRVTIYADNDERATELWNMAKASELWNMAKAFNLRIVIESWDDFVMYFTTQDFLMKGSVILVV